MSFWKKEPAVIVGLVGSAISVGTAFGLKLTTEQVGAITALTSALLALVTRSQVTPTGGQE